MNTAMDCQKILVVDDDRRLQELVKTFLSPFNYQIYHSYSGDDIDNDVQKIQPHLVLLDILMPGTDGLTALKRLRHLSSTPVIMLSARSGVTDRILSLEMGADDYLGKPFDPYELLARIKSVLRRTAQQQDCARAKAFPVSWQESGGIVLNAVHSHLEYKGGYGKLTTAECRILSLLIQNQGRVLSREALMAEVSGNEYIANERNIDVHICRIRNVCKRLGITEARLQTVRGTGYCWVVES